VIDLFDATMVEQGCATLVSRGRELKSASNKTPFQRLGKLLMTPLHKLSPQSIGMYLVSLPLNLIPVVGTAAFILLQGRMAGPRYHARYFQLKMLSPQARDAFVKSHRGAYTGFGIADAILNLVPFASIPFTFTHAIGGALWAAELEKHTSTPEQEPEPSRKARGEL